jgi:hypothetical protein
VKSRISFEEFSRRFPAEFVRYFHAISGLRFSEQPESAEFRLMFREFFVCDGHVYCDAYDWEAPSGPLFPSAMIRWNRRMHRAW